MWAVRQAARSVLVIAALSGVLVSGRYASGQAVAAVTGPVTVAQAASARPASSIAQVWAARFEGEGGSTVASAVKVSPDGSTVYVTGGSQPVIGTYDFATVAYNAVTGAQQWASYYAGPGPGGFPAAGLVVSADGGVVYVTGPSGGPGTGLDYATVAYDAVTGAQLWVSRYDGPGSGDDGSTSLALSSDGHALFVTGGSPGAGSQNDYATVAYNAATGAQLWVSRYNGPGNGKDYALGVVASQAGTVVYVTGGSTGIGSGFDYATVAYSASDGAQLWVSRYNGTSNARDYAHGLALSPDGQTVFVTGATRDQGHGVDYATIAYNAATGSTRWARRYNGPGNNTDDAIAIAAGSFGRVYVTGYSQGPATGQDYATIAYSAATGAQLWISRFNGTASRNDMATALAVGPVGNTVYVTGFSTAARAAGYRYATVAYGAATGRQLWVRAYGVSGGGSLASAVATGPRGYSVFVTGASQGSSGYNYATVGYRD